MRGCDQELCAHWTGDGCICRVLDIDHPQPDDLGDLFFGAIETFFDTLVSFPPFSWLDRLLSGPVSPSR